MDLTDEVKWRAVEARDARLDGAFVYAVQTTGVYCRPSCPSRRPRRERVAFFSGPEAAETAGFRACRRCEPGKPTTARDELVERARQWIEDHADETVRLADLGRELGVSPYHLQRTFKRALGFTPRQYAEARRLASLKARLRAGEEVTSALHGAGYGSSSRLYEHAHARLGMTPSTYRRGGKGVLVKYTIVDCPLGRLIVGATERGICAVGLSSSDQDLEAFIRAELPAAQIDRDDAALSPLAQALLAHLEGGRAELDLPTDAQGTTYQRKVWDALRMIPYGETRTYSDVAAALGEPRAMRAVARACAANPLAVVVPCHRVLRKDGHLGGYRWGLERKAALLEREEEQAHRAPSATPLPAASQG